MFTIIMFQKSACAGIIKETVDYALKSDAAMVCCGDFRLYVLGQIIYSVIGKDRAKNENNSFTRIRTNSTGLEKSSLPAFIF